jgi:hypothetical protein
MSSDIDAMFALARAYYVTGDDAAAVELYDRILFQAKYQNQKVEAQKNKEIVLGRLYG